MSAPHPIISADDHLDLHALPPQLWRERVAAKWRERAPRVVAGPEGDDWVADGVPLGASGPRRGAFALNAIGRAGIEDRDGRRASDPQLRVADMDRDGIQSQLIYGPGPTTGLRITDPALRSVCLSAYNDWASDFNDQSRGRLWALAYLPNHDPREAVRELQRAAAAGHRGAVFEVFDTDARPWEPDWESLWAAAAETGLPISFHLGGGTSMLRLEATRPMTHNLGVASVMPMQLDEPLSAMLFSGVLDRHPGARMVLAESGLGWIPYLLERADRLQRLGGLPESGFEMLRSEVFARQIYATFEVDRVGLQLAADFGSDNYLWAADYPHPNSTFPDSARALASQFDGFDPDLRRKLTYANAARLYGLEAGEEAE